MATCKSCRSPILWATVLPSRKAMPVDPDPDPDDGNVLLERSGSRTIATVLGPIEAALARQLDTPLHTSHFATCPNADQHRAPR